MPTPIPFLSILGLTKASTIFGASPKTSLALAAAYASAIGSVHPIAGTSSFFKISI